MPVKRKVGSKNELFLAADGIVTKKTGILV